MNETLIKSIKKVINDANLMDKNDYLQKLLLLCNEKQMDMWNKMYPNGPKDIDWAIKQVEGGLQALAVRCSELDNVLVDFNNYKCESQDTINSLKKQSYDLEQTLASARSEIKMLDNPIALQNAEVQKRLEKLDALEAGGVDNWEWYGEAMSGVNDE